jgi:hypothetical protein
VLPLPARAAGISRRSRRGPGRVEWVHDASSNAFAFRDTHDLLDRFVSLFAELDTKRPPARVGRFVEFWGPLYCGRSADGPAFNAAIGQGFRHSDRWWETTDERVSWLREMNPDLIPRLAAEKPEQRFSSDTIPHRVESRPVVLNCADLEVLEPLLDALDGKGLPMWEPLDRWRLLARKLRAIMHVAGTFARGRSVRRDELSEAWAWPSRDRTRFADGPFDGEELAGIVQELIESADLRPRATWHEGDFKGRPVKRLISFLEPASGEWTLYSLLISELLDKLSSDSNDFLACQNCGRYYARKRYKGRTDLCAGCYLTHRMARKAASERGRRTADDSQPHDHTPTSTPTSANNGE